IATGLAPSFDSICPSVILKSAPMRSILLTKQMRGTRYLSACRHTVSDCGSTPETASNTAHAPSSTRSERSTSAVKSTCPGVSMMLIRMLRQKQVVAGGRIVLARRPPLPAIMRERLVGFRHPVRVLTLLHGAAAKVRGVQQLVRELLLHRLAI